MHLLLWQISSSRQSGLITHSTVGEVGKKVEHSNFVIKNSGQTTSAAAAIVEGEREAAATGTTSGKKGEGAAAVATETSRKGD